MKKILIIGASGQIGSDLTRELRSRFGSQNVIATDIKHATAEVLEGGPFEILDVMDKNRIAEIINKYKITEVYHLAAILSGNAEKKPKWAWDINMDSLFNVLDIAVDKKIEKVFWPSSMGAFGPTTPSVNTPQLTIMEPSTVYGISKLAGERWCEYYFNKYELDVRSLRYPGLISWKTEAGGGTTDYAVEIFYEAVRKKKYECFLYENTALPMMYMDDAVRATIMLMEAPSEKIKIRSSYNLGGISFTPQEIADEIRKHITELKVTYKPDFRQAIADSWPRSINDEVAQKDWGWKHEYDLPKMTRVMIENIRKKLSK
ncbi:MAG: NAD-dependent epimerase [Bacteroidetes bacterium GWF2_33_16]|nr:MAG: NAD-dependent epimerase [Bacteroidetes bacterium GWE2_32_14]OFY04116.1 MAG: NAD-dependent epimerase [Bacteroidetes bacterium GWF2_33_16]